MLLVLRAGKARTSNKESFPVKSSLWLFLVPRCLCLLHVPESLPVWCYKDTASAYKSHSLASKSFWKPFQNGEKTFLLSVRVFVSHITLVLLCFKMTKCVTGSKVLDTDVIYMASYEKHNKCFDKFLTQIFHLDFFPKLFKSFSLEGAALETLLFFLLKAQLHTWRLEQALWLFPDNVPCWQCSEHRILVLVPFRHGLLDKYF